MKNTLLVFGVKILTQVRFPVAVQRWNGSAAIFKNKIAFWCDHSKPNASRQYKNTVFCSFRKIYLAVQAFSFTLYCHAPNQWKRRGRKCKMEVWREKGVKWVTVKLRKSHLSLSMDFLLVFAHTGLSKLPDSLSTAGDKWVKDKRRKKKKEVWESSWMER